MKYCIFFFSLAITANAKAQSNLHTDSLTLYHHHFRSDKLFSASQNAITNPEQITTNNSVLILPAPKLTYIDKSNDFDIYKATPDNMFVVKPLDGTAHTSVKLRFVPNVPVADKAE
jgi:hypothetical protein